jgi:release factor glutamine methyltransferase
MEYVTGKTRKDWMLDDQTNLSESQQNVLTELIQKLESGTPMQYAIEEADFMSEIFFVDESVLIPRPETEELVHWILNDLDSSRRMVLDIGTGSGCIAISLSKHRGSWSISACDTSNEALVVARRNARELKVVSEIVFYKEDILNPSTLYDNELDVIVSNPPYVTESDKDLMTKQVTEHEPSVALFVPDTDPLQFYREIGTYGLKALKSGGSLYFEIHTDKGNEVLELLKNQGYTDVVLKQDLSGRDRMVRATTPTD